MRAHLFRGVAALVLLAGAMGTSVLTAASVKAEGFSSGESVTLTDAQRAKILRAITSDRGANDPAGIDRVISEPSKPASSTRTLPASPSGDIVVGTAVPETLPLTPVPDSIGVEVPALRRLSYAQIDGRFLLIDPATNLVLGEINR